MMFFLVCFDIVDNKTRYRVVKILKGYGTRVQKSVFECANMTEHKFVKMKSDLEDLIDHGEDTIRYYPLCRSCNRNVEFSGIGTLPYVKHFAVL
jgi:CRISPR-associated protein Cas2